MDAAQSDPGNLLFAYGTLQIRTGIEAVDLAMKEAGDSLGRGYIHGLLYDLGDYPGAVACGPGSAAPRIWGTLMRLREPAALFSVLDDYEGFHAGDPAGSEFIRGPAKVFLPDAGGNFMDQVYVCHVYFYNLPVTGKRRIESGDFLAG